MLNQQTINALIELNSSPLCIDPSMGILSARTEKQKKIIDYAYTGEGTVMIQVSGFINQRNNLVTQILGGTPLDHFRRVLTQLVNDRTVKKIYLEFDSYGGSVFGVTETASLIRKLREAKPIIGLINASACSAAYWLASQCSQLFITPSGQAGSIGVVMTHCDQSVKNKKDGVTVKYIYSGRYKTESNPHEPLTAEAYDNLYQTAHTIYVNFINDVALGRKVSTAKVEQHYGQGRSLLAKDALAVGMVDGIAAVSDINQNGRASKRGQFLMDIHRILNAN